MNLYVSIQKDVYNILNDKNKLDSSIMQLNLFCDKKKYEGRRYIFKLVDTKMFFSKDVQTLNGGFVRVETLVRKGKLLILIS